MHAAQQHAFLGINFFKKVCLHTFLKKLMPKNYPEKTVGSVAILQQTPAVYYLIILPQSLFFKKEKTPKPDRIRS